MKKIILFLVLGIFLLGIITAVSFGIIKGDFTEKVLTIDTGKLCEMELTKNVLSKQCTKDTPKEIDISESSISITKNPKTGVIKIEYS